MFASSHPPYTLRHTFVLENVVLKFVFLCNDDLLIRLLYFYEHFPPHPSFHTPGLYSISFCCIVQKERTANRSLKSCNKILFLLETFVGFFFPLIMYSVEKCLLLITTTMHLRELSPIDYLKYNSILSR